MSKRFLSEFAEEDEDSVQEQEHPSKKITTNEISIADVKDDSSLITVVSAFVDTVNAGSNSSSSCSSSARNVTVHSGSQQTSGHRTKARAEDECDLTKDEAKDADSSREMVQFQLISDMHIEHRGEDFAPESFIEKSAPIIALLGDIGSIADPRFELFVRWCSENFELVLFVPGNHEYYSSNPLADIQYFKARMREMFASFYNVIMLDNACHPYRDVMFIGSTLWSNVPNQHHDEVTRGMNDFQVIYSSPGVLFTPRQSSELFKANVAFIESSIVDACLQGLKPVVLTHHVPSFKNTSDPYFNGRPTNHAFASRINFDNSPFKPVLWCAGHTHFNFDHEEEGYHLVSNQLGYPGKKKAAKFRKNFVLFV